MSHHINNLFTSIQQREGYVCVFSPLDVYNFVNQIVFTLSIIQHMFLPQ